MQQREDHRCVQGESPLDIKQMIWWFEDSKDVKDGERTRESKYHAFNEHVPVTAVSTKGRLSGSLHVLTVISRIMPLLKI